MGLVVWIVIISMGVLDVGLGMCWRMGYVVLVGRVRILLDVCCRVRVLLHVWNVTLAILGPVRASVSRFLVKYLIAYIVLVTLHVQFARPVTHSMHNKMYVSIILLL